MVVTIFMYVPCIVYILLFRPTNAQHTYNSDFYCKYSYMFSMQEINKLKHFNLFIL